MRNTSAVAPQLVVGWLEELPEVCAISQDLIARLENSRVSSVSWVGDNAADAIQHLHSFNDLLFSASNKIEEAFNVDFEGSPISAANEVEEARDEEAFQVTYFLRMEQYQTERKS